MEIDGSYGEGGGQILRSAVALSALTGKEISITNIRAKRERPGLAAQHLTAVKGVASLCSATVEGAQVGSTALVFRPQKISAGMHRLDVGTAGSIPLVLQSCLLASARTIDVTELEIVGGTNVRMSPAIDYYEQVLLPMLSRMRLNVSLRIVRRGFYPQGGGMVTASIVGAARLEGLDLRERGELLQLGGTCFSQNLPDHVCKRISHAAMEAFLGERTTMRSERTTGASSGAGIQLHARYANTILGGDALGERGIPSEQVGASAASALKVEIDGGGTLDVHAADQLLPYMALADSASCFKVREATEHLRTHAWLIERFLGTEITIERSNGVAIVEVRP